jgi:hypothetical protein
VVLDQASGTKLDGNSAVVYGRNVIFVYTKGHELLELKPEVAVILAP